MKLCRFKNSRNEASVGLVVENDFVVDLAAAGVTDLTSLLERDDPAAAVAEWSRRDLPRLPLSALRLCAPVERQEVWAAGVTYLRSKTARMKESSFSASAYDLVYAAERPELFFKSMPDKVVAPGEPVGIRGDARWNVPEPELALVLNSRGRIVCYTIGNDMSSRDIEGENLLYLPQAKIYRASCALGPCLRLAASEAEAREWAIQIGIWRNASRVFAGETSVAQIKRTFEELARFLFRSQEFPHGAVLLTGTGIVPPDQFTLQEQDEIEIHISGIGVLRNPVIVV